jgi:hypothetical protein
MPVEQWKDIPEFPDYMVSDRGQVYSRRAENLLKMNKTLQGGLKVTLSVDGERYTRSVRVLVAQAFVDPPLGGLEFHASAVPDTVIILNGDQDNVCAYNLAWRPRWYANQYARQLKVEVHPLHYLNRPVQNAQTGQLYANVIEAGQREGLLYSDIYRSTRDGIEIWPGFTRFVTP